MISESVSIFIRPEKEPLPHLLAALRADLVTVGLGPYRAELQLARPRAELVPVLKRIHGIVEGARGVLLSMPRTAEVVIRCESLFNIEKTIGGALKRLEMEGFGK